MIGIEESLNHIGFFHKNRGYDQNIDCMYVGRHGSPDEHNSEVGGLNDDEIQGGGDILHTTREGVQSHQSYAGTAIAHGHNNVHASTPQTTGTRYMLIIKHHFNRTDKPTILSREVVAEGKLIRVWSPNKVVPLGNRQVPEGRRIFPFLTEESIMLSFGQLKDTFGQTVVAAAFAE
eukprot:scaffold4772_cov153-Amphora_coffeaeformis.AAC.7